ncbi:hypothetical protein SEVIR_5G006350v4 [Setaria viridis]
MQSPTHHQCSVQVMIIISHLHRHHFPVDLDTAQCFSTTCTSGSGGRALATMRMRPSLPASPRAVVPAAAPRHAEAALDVLVQARTSTASPARMSWRDTKERPLPREAVRAGLAVERTPARAARGRTPGGAPPP